MNGRRVSTLLIWLVILAGAALVVARANYVTDLSAFLPRKPTPAQQLLVDQLRDGPASRVILIAVEGGDAESRAKTSQGMAAILRRDAQFAAVSNGESLASQSDREFLFKHRYLLSDAVDAARFSVEGLHAALDDTIADLASPAGLLFKSLLPRDPTGELPHIVDQLGDIAQPESRGGVWVSKDESRALAVAQTNASGSDTDAQGRALAAIQAAFDATLKAAGPAASALRLKMSGPGVFAVASRAKIQQAAMRLSLLSGALIVALLLAVYRSPLVLGLGLLPVASAAVVGVAAVALGFGLVHGITLGFGITLIGESVDYSIYYFIQSRRGNGAPGADSWQRQWWPTVRLGMLTSVCGFLSLLPSGFPGLQQLGLYSICGLLAAALVTRFVLPELMPGSFRIHDLSAIGAWIERRLAPLHRLTALGLAVLLAVVVVPALIVLIVNRGDLWNRELSALSPVPKAELDFDAKLRADLGAADVIDIVVISGADLEAVLEGAERAAAALTPLVGAGVIGGFDTPTQYLPSTATQEARRGSLPPRSQLKDNLSKASVGLKLRADKLQPFLEDVEAARHGPLLGARDLKGTSMNAGFESMILHEQERWNALLPLRLGSPQQVIDRDRVAAALKSAGLDSAKVLDLKRSSDELYDDYLTEAIRLSAGGFAALTVLLIVTLRSLRRVLRVLLPLVLAVVVVAAALIVGGAHFTILHLVGMLLIVAVGSNYALFFDRQTQGSARESGALTLASLVVANAGTVIGFGLLSFSGVPVLIALGTTVAPGAFLALLFSALLSRA